ncbi:hypothetical protein GCM10010499_42940 [Streptomyces thermoviolaceus subsp. apingens]|nr:hypothetical protein GCM10010499_42940 [Streptomyces thermoviolaceus subsp. apingens]
MPGSSSGTKEYGCPHAVQKPSVRPGRPPRARPTGAPHREREQNRLRSGTSGSCSTIERGPGRGTRGTRGTCTSPAPSRPRPEEPDAEEEPRTGSGRRDRDAPVDPGAPAAGGAPRPGPAAAVDDGPSPGPAATVGTEQVGPSADTTGAGPQMSQDNSPPPTSSYVPSQSGR